MTQHYSDTRKIDPTRGDTLADGSPNDGDRIEIGPTLLALREWEDAGLTAPNLEAMRKYRWKRLTQHIVDRDYGGLLMFDPLNIRYATDSTNMQLWNTHNPFRAVLLCADGYMVIWDYKNSPFLTDFNPLVREQRSGADLFYFDRGDKVDIAADVFVQRAHMWHAAPRHATGPGRAHHHLGQQARSQSGRLGQPGSGLALAARGHGHIHRQHQHLEPGRFGARQHVLANIGVFWGVQLEPALIPQIWGKILGGLGGDCG